MIRAADRLLQREDPVYPLGLHMVDLDSRPTAQQIEELIDAVRRDPASAFMQLGESYLALGRPKDVIEVCNVGLGRAPDHIEGRVLLARAHHAMHQWKEAQGELLRVVKVDRTNKVGFALLGEVLLRRGDTERAVPVLQHAQNLDPTSSHVLALLKRARTGEPLDPPAPLPVPVLPRDVAVVQAVAPTRMVQAYQEPEPAPMPPPRVQKPAPVPVPVPSIDGVRPRILSKKPQNAAAAALRQSAAVGENYLNELLTGGLLDVAGVRLPDVQYDLRPDRRWGRSARRLFVLLFLVLFMGAGGGGAWYFWTKQQTVAAVARLQREAKEKLSDGSYDGLVGALTSLSSALTKDPDNALTLAYVGEAAGLQALLYGTDVAPATTALTHAATEIKKAEQPGYREVVLGRAAVKLAQVPESNAMTVTLYEAMDLINGYLAIKKDDRWARWLLGRAQLIAGERKNAAASFSAAGEGDTGLLVAKIELADMAAIEGRLDDALAQYDSVNKLSKDHPLALLGLSLARVEADVDTSAAVDDLNVKLDKELGPRGKAYRQLALAFANVGLEDYTRAKEAAAAAVGVSEPRFLVRKAYLELVLGNLAEAASARQKVQWYGKQTPDPDPGALLVDAGLQMVAGLAAPAYERAKDLEDLRARRIAAWALIDLERPKDAADEVEKFLAKAPESLEGKALRDYCKIVSGPVKEREDAITSLQKLNRGAKAKTVQHLLGQSLLRLGRVKEGQDELAHAVSEADEEHPHPVVYRSRTLLAELLVAEGKLPEAEKELEAALAANAGYLPARGAQALLLLKAGKVEDSYVLLQPIAAESPVLSPNLTLAWIEALGTRKGAKAEDKAAAQELLQKLVSDGAPVPAAEVERLAEALGAKLGGAEAEPPKKAPPRRPRRR